MLRFWRGCGASRSKDEVPGKMRFEKSRVRVAELFLEVAFFLTAQIPFSEDLEVIRYLGKVGGWPFRS